MTTKFFEGILYAMDDWEACEVWQLAATNDGYNNSKTLVSAEKASRAKLIRS